MPAQQPLSLSAKQAIFAQNVAKLIAYAATLPNHRVRLGEALRTEEQHQFNIKAGKTKAGRSRHQDRMAIDLILDKRDSAEAWVYQTGTPAYKPLGIYWVDLNAANRWGGDFNKDGDRTTNDAWDGNHFEMM